MNESAAQDSSEPSVSFLPAGDTALVVEFGRVVDRDLSTKVVRLRERVEAANIDGVRETLPTFRSLLIQYDPGLTSAARLTEQIASLLRIEAANAGPRRLWRVPACYDERCAPDLIEVAERTGMSPGEVVSQHGATQFHVYMIGFLPGFPYMGDLPQALQLPRRTDPRVRVPPGSIAIALRQTAIYPVESPGGWHLIGATPIRLFDPGWSRPSLFAPGDAVRFEPITFEAYAEMRAAGENGGYVLAPEEDAV